MEWLTYAVQIIAVLSFIGGVCSAIFRIVVIKPLSTSIDALSECVKELRDDVKNNSTRLNRLETAIERVEKATVTAHARIDKFLHDARSEPGN